MATATVLSSIAIIVISIVTGLISFYIISDLSKLKRKKQLEEIASQIVNFIIFIWLGKILLNLSVFIKDPLAILAYPSDSHAFYFAVLLSAIMLAYKSIRKQLDVRELMNSFLPVFLVASFVYEFIQIVWYKDTYSIGYLVLLTVLLVIYLLIRDQVTKPVLIIVILTGWTAGTLTLALILPFTTVFGYIMAPWFVGLFFLTSVTIIFYKQRKRVS